MAAETFYDAEKLEITDLDTFGSTDAGAPESVRSDMINVVSRLTERSLAVPIILVVTNNSDLPLHSVFLEVIIRPSVALRDVSNQVEHTYTSRWVPSAVARYFTASKAHALLDKPLAELESTLDQWREKGNLKETDGTWSFSIKWDSLQPQRQRLIEPIPLAIPFDNVRIQVDVKVFADSLPKPLVLSVWLNVVVKSKKISTRDLRLEFRRGDENVSEALVAAVMSPESKRSGRKGAKER